MTMRLVLRLLGREVATLGFEDEDEGAHDHEPIDEPGDCTTYPIGFSHWPTLDEVGLPDRDY